MSAPQPANTSEELRTKIHEITIEMRRDDKQGWIDRNTERMDSIMQLIADHDAKLYAALEDEKKNVTLYFKGEVPVHFEAVPLVSARKVFNMKEQ